MEFGIAHHAVYLILGQATGSSDGDLLFPACTLVTSRDIENAVGINIESYLNLRNASWGWSDTLEPEVTQALVVTGQFALTLQHVDLNCRLAILSRAKDLALTCRNGRVAINQFGHHTTQGLNAQREWSNIEQEYISHVTLEDTRLDCRADGYHFIRIDTFVWLFAEDLAYQVSYSRHARLPTNQDYLVYITCPNTCIFKSLHDRAACALDQIAYQLL